MRFIEAMSFPAPGMGFDKCDSAPVQDYNGDNAKEHLLPQRYLVHTCNRVEIAVPNLVLSYC